MPWFVPLIMSLISTGINTATSITNNNKQLSFQQKQLVDQQKAEQDNINNQRLMNQQQQQINNQQTVNQFASNLNKGYSTGLLSNQMPASTGIGVQGLNGTNYLNEDSFLAKVGGLFSKKVNAKSTVRDDNNLYFDRIEYAKCGGRFKRK